MAATSTKPAPLALGARDADGGNRVEMLGRRGGGGRTDVTVDQLLNEFARDVRTPYATPRHAPQPWTPPVAVPESSETEQLRARVVELETRLRSLEAANQIRNDGAGRLNQRVMAVLEQLVAELRERS